MNRYLLAGCAAAALALGAGAANAADFQVKVGGDAYFEGGYVSQDKDSGLRSTEFRNRFRLNIVPSAKADNGLEYGGRVRIRANSGTANLDGDRAYIWAQGSFGQVRLGVANSYNDDTYYSRPFDYQILGIYDPYVNFLSGSAVASEFASIGGTNVLTAQSMTGNTNSTKAIYISPRFSGFQLGLSYTPRNDSNLSDVNRAKVTTSQTTFQDIYEVGLNYNNTFGGVAVKASAGYMGGKSETANTEDLKSWQVGGNVGYAGFAFGGGAVGHGESGQTKSALYKKDALSWNVGAQYTTGPLVVGAAYIQGKDAGSVNVAGDRTAKIINVGALYTIAPGLSAGLEYDHFKVDADASGTSDKGDIVILRSVLAF